MNTRIALRRIVPALFISVALIGCTDFEPTRVSGPASPALTTSADLDAPLRSYLARLAFTGRVASTLEARLGRRIDRQLADIGRMLWFDPIHGLNGDNTCGGCHSNPDTMKPYGIPTDQASKYLQSVHANALLKKQDLSAPTCNDCHGNHGAAPPGVASVENVCSNCHAFQAQLFDASPHKQAFAGAGE